MFGAGFAGREGFKPGRLGHIEQPLIEDAGRILAIAQRPLEIDAIDHDIGAFAAEIDEAFMALGIDDKDRRDMTVEAEEGLDAIIEDDGRLRTPATISES